MTNAATPLLFISGAGLPAWIWDEVRAALPDVPSHVAGRARSPKATLAEHAAVALAEAPWPEFLVVAHSIGGVIACQMSGIAPDRIRGVLGVAAIVPKVGSSFLGALPFPNKLVMAAIIALVGTKPPDRLLRSGVAEGLSEAVADRLVADFVPESKALYRNRLGGRRLPAQIGYLYTENDTDFPKALQSKYASELGAGWTRSMPTGHQPMLEQPAACAAVIKAFADTVRP